jgi:hypothetical protein
MDSFTIAVLIGGVAVLLILAGLVVADRGAKSPSFGASLFRYPCYPSRWFGEDR